jgi:hypothetical protein
MHNTPFIKCFENPLTETKIDVHRPILARKYGNRLIPMANEKRNSYREISDATL